MTQDELKQAVARTAFEYVESLLEKGHRYRRRHRIHRESIYR